MERKKLWYLLVAAMAAAALGATVAVLAKAVILLIK